MKKWVLLVSIVVITCTVSNLSAVIIFDSDAVIQGVDYYTERVLVCDGSSDFSTTLEMTSGVVLKGLSSYDKSTVNVSGGQIHSGLYSYESSTINVSGWGEISGDLIAYDLSTTNVYGGVLSELSSCNQSVINISGGYVSELEGYDQSTINIAGGFVNLAAGYGNNITNIWGGEIFGLYAEDSSIINIYGYGFAYDHYDGPIPEREGYLTGFWQNGTAFTISLAKGNDVTYNHLNLHIIPEPATILLLALGSLALIRRRR